MLASTSEVYNTYGSRMRPDDGRAIPTFIRQALAGEPLTVAGDGHQTRSVCHVDDPGIRRPDTTLAERVLDWRPRVSWMDGLRSTVQWFRRALAEPA